MARKDEYRATDYPGIKQRIKDGKYLVVIDLGRQPKLDKKTGAMVLKQCKTQKAFDTLKEAKAYQGENNKAKKTKRCQKWLERSHSNKPLLTITQNTAAAGVPPMQHKKQTRNAG